ncbi:hypothetical protein ACQ33O_09510 [Ferruginibacter sp. SUN002]|uniref:hypothetical protein n=1 Tax=Ferruginibacter sp. SUN002 TaxID=2937789 RepID=UPI003D35FA77
MSIKNLTIVSAALLLLNSCKDNPKAKAEENIKKYMTENINDPKGYESLRFGELKSDSSSIDDDKTFQLYEDSVKLTETKTDSVRQKYLANNISYLDYLKLSSVYNQEAIDILDRKIKFIHNFKGKPCGFNIMHIYRKKNSKGATVLDSMCFRLDSSYSIKPKSYYSLLNKD